MLIIWILMIVVSSVWIKFACDPFEESADFLGRNLGHGIKGATINAIGSSLPELFVTVLCLFVFKDTAGFSSGIATSAGSAVFNAAVIPALVLMAISLKMNIKHVSIKKSVILRDGITYLITIIVFSMIITLPSLTWWMGGALVGIYVLYTLILIRLQSTFVREDLEENEAQEDSDDRTPPNRFLALLKFDFKTVFFGNAEYTKFSAWLTISLATLNIGAACYLLTHSIVEVAHIWKMNTFFVAVLLAAAATSVPDTIISVKDALKGNYEDAVANAIGSNIFDICIGLGLPILIYTLINGDLVIAPENAMGIFDLVIVLLFLSTIVFFAFLVPKKVGFKTGLLLMLLYVGYGVFAIASGLEHAWAKQMSVLIRGAFNF